MGTAAVIVTYGPDAGFADRLRRVADQVDRVIIIDNHSAPQTREWLRGLTTERIELIENRRNEGIARALNQGMVRAAGRDATWVLTLDQDTEVDPDIVQALRAIWERCPFKERVGMIGANARSRHRALLAVRVRETALGFVEAKTVITSGTLLAAAAYRAAGPFREDFFIEGVDLEYCLRLRRHGFRILLSCRPLMTHAAGKMEEHRLIRRIIIVPNHAPWRYYYMVRNVVRILRMYGSAEPAWALTAFLNIGKMMAKVLLFESHRVEKLKCVFLGVWDAFTGADRQQFLTDHCEAPRSRG